MLWLLLSSIGYIFNIGYEDVGDLSPLTERVPQELDPISVALCVSMVSILSVGLKYRWKCAIRVRSIMSHPTRFLNDGNLPAQRRVWTRRRYSFHLEALKQSGVLKGIPHANHSVMYSSYFSIKKTEGLDRAIFNGRKVSQLFSRPPPVNLIRTSLLVQMLHKLSVEHKRLYCIAGDFRHWFHQLSCEQLSRFFGVACAGMYYQWQSWPMGFSWSPFAAQVISWLVLTSGLSEEVADLSFREDEELPFFIPLRGGGFIVVYYDNYLICCTNSQTAFTIHRQLQNNCQEYNVAVKEHLLIFPQQELEMAKIELEKQLWQGLNVHCNPQKVCAMEEGFVYLGLHFRVNNKLEWRVDRDKIERLPRKIPLVLTPRHVARIVGKILSAFLPGGDPLGSNTLMVGCIDALRIAAKEAYIRGSWDCCVGELTERNRERLEEGWMQLLNNNWCSLAVRSEMQHTIIVATDASNWGYGCVMLDTSGNVLKQYKRPWSEGEKQLHIFIREILAAERGLMLWKESKWFSQDTRVILVIDNTAAAWAFQRGFTCNTIAMRSISRVLALYHQWLVCTVVTSDNVADRPSRNKLVDEGLARRTSDAVKEFMKGRRTGCITNIIVEPEKRVRHMECSDENELLLDDCDCDHVTSTGDLDHKMCGGEEEEREDVD